MKIFTREFFLSHHTPPIEIIPDTKYREDTDRQKEFPGVPVPIQITGRELDRMVEACNWWAEKNLFGNLGLKKAVEHLDKIIAVVNEQAEDDGLWFAGMYNPCLKREAYLQQALRRLHKVIEE